MKNKKGFTLIELLAVIVILAIISIIAVPIVLNIIDTARRGSAESSTNGYIDAVEYYNASLSMKGQPLMDGEYDVADLEIKLDGKKPAYGTVTIKKGIVESADMCINGYIVEYKNKKAEAHSTCNGDVDDVNPILTIDEIKKTSNRIEIKFTAKDLESGIDNTICEYGTTSNYGTTAKLNSITNGSCIIENANQDTIYYYKITTIDKNKNETVVRGNTSPESILKPVVTSDSNWETSKVVGIEYKGTGIETPAYFVKTTVNTTSDINVTSCTGSLPKTASECTGESTKEIIKDTWYLVSGTKLNLTLNENGSIYTYTSDGLNIASSDVYTITKIDKTEPELVSTLSVTTKTDRATLSMECSDESGITKYEFSKDEGKTWVNNGTSNSYTFKDLTQTTDYKFVGRCTNGSGLITASNKDGKTSSIIAPTISADNEWSTSKVVNIEYNGSGIENPVYFMKSTVNTTSDINVTSCTGSLPKTASECTGTSTKEITKDTWYLVSGTEVNITLNENGSIYAYTSDGQNLASSTVYTVTTIDTIAPTCTIKGDSTEWINTNRTIYYGCDDKEMGCDESYNGGSITFEETIKTSVIPEYTIKDKAGNQTNCPARTANVYVDKIEPIVMLNGYYGSKEQINALTSLANFDENIANGSLIDYEEKQWLNADEALAFRANSSDNDSGIESLVCEDPRLETSTSYPNFNTWRRITNTWSGIFEFKCTAIDNAGNIATTTYEVWRDAKPPTLTVTNYYALTKDEIATYPTDVPYVNDTWVNGYVSSKASAKDALNPVTLYYTRTPDATLGGSGAQEKTYTAEAGVAAGHKTYSEAQGISYYTYKACDSVGNCTTVNRTLKLDRTVPIATNFTVSKSSTNANIYMTCDDMSGTSEYEFSSDGGNTWISNGTSTSYAFTGLNSSTTYDFKARCTNGAGLKSPTGYKRIIYLDPTNLSRSCNSSNSVSTTETKTGCMKWYAFAETDTTYDLLLDHNTTLGVLWNSTGDSTVMKEVKEDLDNLVSTYGWKVTPRLISAPEITKIVGEEFDNVGTFYFDTGDRYEPDTYEGKYSWLYNYTSGCAKYGCAKEAADTVGYWTSTEYSSRTVYRVDYYGRLYYNFVTEVSSNRGVRPVITISKSVVS